MYLNKSEGWRIVWSYGPYEKNLFQKFSKFGPAQDGCHRPLPHFYAEKPPCITQATSLGRIAGGACIAVPAAKTLVFPRCSCTEIDLKKLKAQPSLFLSCNSRQMWKTDAWPPLIVSFSLFDIRCASANSSLWHSNASSDYPSISIVNAALFPSE